MGLCEIMNHNLEKQNGDIGPVLLILRLPA